MGREVIEHVYSHAKQELGVGVGGGSMHWHTQNSNHAAQLLPVKVAERSDLVMYQKWL